MHATKLPICEKIPCETTLRPVQCSARYEIKMQYDGVEMAAPTFTILGSYVPCTCMLEEPLYGRTSPDNLLLMLRSFSLLTLQTFMSKSPVRASTRKGQDEAPSRVCCSPRLPRYATSHRQRTAATRGAHKLLQRYQNNDSPLVAGE
jgi:hypothetical protein